MSNTVAGYVSVYLLDNPFCIDRAYDYFIPMALADAISPGTFVTVPFGRGNKKQLALITAVADHPITAAEVGISPHQIKPIGGVCAERLSLSPEQLALCFFLKDQTLCTMGEAVRTVVPSSALAKITEYYRPSIGTDREKSLSGLDSADLMIYEYIRTRGHISLDTLKTRFGVSAAQSVTKLLSKHLIDKELNVKQPAPPTERHYRLAISVEEALSIVKGTHSSLKLTSAKQKTVLTALSEADGSISGKQLSQVTDAGRAQFRALVEKGLLLEEDVEVLPDGLRESPTEGEFRPLELSQEQAEAIHTLEALVATGEPKAALLHGVTGSGKTCVILEMIDRMLAQNKGVIVLLPEISLTPQMLSIFHGRYGKKVAVIHSGLSAGERLASHIRIQQGDAPVVVGTRSAAFAPMPNLGMMVIDEEQEHTYKSDMNPKYHARDIARFRCAFNKALLLLASATPSLESYQKAKEGKYTLIRMTKRYGAAALPTVQIADMRKEPMQGSTTPLGQALSTELIRVAGEGNQSVLFLNRRGYNTQVVCRSCGKAVSCPNCSVAMNYHVKKGSYDNGELVCHWCGTRRPHPDACPDCGSAHLTRMGYGTQRIEQELETLLPHATVMRMDADTTSTKSAYHDLLGAFRRHEADVLLGTQMVTKGHDFPDVTLVGVLMADASLYLDDYRAAERTFSMLTQVIGRAGRADKPGLAVIQTMNPDSDVIKLACAQDYETFFEREIKLRKLLVFPPFCDIALFTVTSSDEKELHKACLRLNEMLRVLSKTEYADVPIITFGPFEAPVYRLDNVYRMRMVVKCRLNKRSRSLFTDIINQLASTSRSTAHPNISIDFNPSSI